ncbi:MAG: FxsA family protein [Gammaproteobacteria bacterium]|nr:FxsA family protein [Gammaproteobacteria bacterium]MCB1850890.1 FxsA family protein [Gammaproteobacteria bacterium]MCP5418472.1 FxsA family protein [Chromatiaceae bacterium]
MNPLLIFLLLFVGIPLIELYFLIQVGSEIGAIPTIALTIFTALLGGMMVKVQGFSTALRVRDALERKEMPALEILEGAVLLMTGIMLLLPGFITDLIGFLLLAPPLRRWLLLYFLKHSGILQRQSPLRPDHPNHADTDVIEGEYRRLNDD